MCACVCLCGCAKDNNKISVDEPQRIATGDEIYSAKNENAVEESANVNGMRFTLTLPMFTEKYNDAAQRVDGVFAINYDKWKAKDGIKKDTNGVEIQYFYYNDSGTNFTVTTEAESGKIVNIGCGTTMANFVAQDENSSSSDAILRKAAVMAAAVCQFPIDSLDVLQDVFYRTTFGNGNSFWYQGFIFSLSTQDNKTDSEKSLMLLRVFPVADELKKDWDVPDYEAYISTAPAAEKLLSEQGK